MRNLSIQVFTVRAGHHERRIIENREMGKRNFATRCRGTARGVLASDGGVSASSLFGFDETQKFIKRKRLGEQNEAIRFDAL